MAATTLGGGSALAQEINIASWNMNWLTMDANEFNQRRDVDIRTLRGYAANVNADVIALQEVESPAAAFRVFGPSYTYFFAGEPGNPRRAAILVRESSTLRVEDSNRYFPLNTTGNITDGVDITLSNGDAKLRLLNVDLYEGCPNENLEVDETMACVNLSDQVNALANYVGDRSQERIPFMLLGDFGRYLSRETQRSIPADMINQLNDRVPPHRGQLQLVNTGTPECWSGRQEDFVDYLIADTRATAMLVPNTFYEIAYSERNFDRNHINLSEHCPIGARFILR